MLVEVLELGSCKLDAGEWFGGVVHTGAGRGRSGHALHMDAGRGPSGPALHILGLKTSQVGCCCVCQEHPLSDYSGKRRSLKV